MTFIETLDDLARHYGRPVAAARVKVTSRLTPAYRRWLEASRFCILASVGPEGTDASPRGDDGPVVRVVDTATLWLPDWRGNDRIDSLRNIVADGRVSLLFMVAGSANVLRVNGTARLSADASLRAAFARDGAQPRTVAVIAIAEVYFQCARAVLRAGLWQTPAPEGLPSPGEMLRDATEGRFDGAAYDADWPGRAARTMW
jgi:PPOX class probable FMN-dependent enzyme